MNQYKV